MLLEIAADLESAPTAAEREDKSKGKAPLAPEVTQAELHGLSRFSEGFSVTESMAEFRALRASVLRLWGATHAESADVIRFNEAIDQVVAESLSRFTVMKDRRARLFQSLLDTSPDLNYIAEPSGALIYANPAFAAAVRLTQAELSDADFFQLAQEFIPDIAAQAREAMRSGVTFRGEMQATVALGDVRTYEYQLVPVCPPGGRCEAIAGNARDITARKVEEDRIRRRASHDLLTDLPNRGLFRERLEHEVQHAARTRLPLALLFIDLDGFKEVNDRLGHAAGDELLQQVAQRIKRRTRVTDTVARLGGDEFTVILTDVTESQHIDTIAATILGDLREPFALAAGEAGISASIGISVYPGDGATSEELVVNSDAAMYAAKSAGRNCYRFFTAAMREAPASLGKTP
ncbi:diguanylate cyclase domain-containing protein [Massilia sp. R2A-15]|uniref:diguanylate cyclase domain-containing protein n=1 Tax=Massilia sp. R2A-15 TaxID=3064278 RepID=UPI0035A6258A